MRLYSAPGKLRCPRCALPLAQPLRLDEAGCAECQGHASALSRCVAAVDYGWPWSMLIGRLKFEGDAGLARVLARRMHTPAAASLLAEADWLTPMPLAPARLAERGFNQSRLLAVHLNASPVLDVLTRIRDTPPQRLLDRATRQRNVRGAFAVDARAAGRLHGRRVLLIDDVMTTGASLQAAALALRAGGATRVDALVLARTPVGGHDGASH